MYSTPRAQLLARDFPGEDSAVGGDRLKRGCVECALEYISSSLKRIQNLVGRRYSELEIDRSKRVLPGFESPIHAASHLN